MNHTRPLLSCLVLVDYRYYSFLATHVYPRVLGLRGEEFHGRGRNNTDNNELTKWVGLICVVCRTIVCVGVVHGATAKREEETLLGPWRGAWLVTFKVGIIGRDHRTGPLDRTIDWSGPLETWRIGRGWPD